MSGVFGLLDPKKPHPVERLARDMGEAMRHRPWYVIESSSDPDAGVALGRVAIGIFNREPQPCTSEDGRLTLCFCGELYDAGPLRRELQQAGHPPRDGSDPELVLRLYQAKGEAFIRALRGPFLLALWDRSRGLLFLGNDRFGLYPLYYAHWAGRFLFAPEVKAILADPALPRHLDLTALAQYMRFQQLLGARTFFEEIKLLPPASLLCFDIPQGSYHIRGYWSVNDIPFRPNVSQSEAGEEAGRLLQGAVRRLSGDALRPGVYLSGGLDSRTIIGLTQRRPITSITYGAANCRDVHYARRIARAVGSDHHWFDLPDGRWVMGCADLHLALTEGSHSWVHAHGMSTLPRARELMDVNLTGWGGVNLWGVRNLPAATERTAASDREFVSRLFHLLNQEWTWPGLTEGEEGVLYREPFRSQLRGLAFDSLREEAARYLECRMEMRRRYFNLFEHDRRLTHNLVTFSRSHLEVRFPFHDYDFFDFMYSLPMAVRGHLELYRGLLHQRCPALSHIPYDHDEFLPTSESLVRSSHALVVRAKRRLNRHLFPIVPEWATLYADYEHYLRTDLKAWGEALLFDRRTLERGIFDADCLRWLWARHQSGPELHTIGRIAPIMTYEMMLRRLYERDDTDPDLRSV